MTVRCVFDNQVHNRIFGRLTSAVLFLSDAADTQKIGVLKSMLIQFIRTAARQEDQAGQHHEDKNKQHNAVWCKEHIGQHYMMR